MYLMMDVDISLQFNNNDNYILSSLENSCDKILTMH